MEYLWRPHPGPQMEFCSRGEFEVLFGGAKGPGKTACLVAEAARDIHIPKYRGVLIRRTFPRLQEVQDRCYDLYPKHGGIYISTEHRWAFPSGARIAIGHCQHEEDKRNYHGKEFHFLGFDELTEFEHSQYTFIVANVRKSSEGLRLRIRCTTNPGGIGHVWVKERFVDLCKPKKQIDYLGGDGVVRKMWVPEYFIDPKTLQSRCFVPATVEDNPSIMLYDPEYVQRLEDLSEIDKMRLRFGIWDAFEGQVFTELSPRIHGCDPFDIPPDWERFMCLDWGYSRPFSIGWYAVDFDGFLWKYREWYGCKDADKIPFPPESANKGLKLTAKEVARGIWEREKERIKYRVADPACWNQQIRKDKTLGPSVAEDMGAEGIHLLKADNNRLLGKLQFHERLRLEESEKEGEEGRPQFVVFHTCKHFWRTVPQLREDPKNPEDVDTNGEDHCYDETRYAMMSRPVLPKHKPPGPPAGSFAAERNRLIRAKKYARRHGVSLAAAYQKIR